jgi:hypothetical protein
MQIMVRFAIQNGKTRSGEIMIGERRPSDRCIKKPVTSKTGLVVNTGVFWSRLGAGARNWELWSSDEQKSLSPSFFDLIRA